MWVGERRADELNRRRSTTLLTAYAFVLSGNGPMWDFRPLANIAMLCEHTTGQGVGEHSPVALFDNFLAALWNRINILDEKMNSTISSHRS